MIDVVKVPFSQLVFKSALKMGSGLAVTLFMPILAAAETAATQPQPPAWAQMVPLIAMVAIFYFLILRPQQKREKQRQGFISALKRGDEVVLSSGMLGRVEGLTDQVITLEIADGVRVKVLRSSIASSVQALTQNATAAVGGKA
jgi:preprotein translocase subunit YajC